MKITRISTLVVNARMRNWVFVKVETDQAGLHGWGEDTLEWKTKGVVVVVRHYSPYGRRFGFSDHTTTRPSSGAWTGRDPGASAARLRNDAKREAKHAEDTRAGENRRRKESQFQPALAQALSIVPQSIGATLRTTKMYEHAPATDNTHAIKKAGKKVPDLATMRPVR